MKHSFVLLSLLGGCVLFDDTPYQENMAGLADADADGFTVTGGDCNDADPDLHPGLEDSCDGQDNDCDGATDEDLPDTVWCEDIDGDGFGNIAQSERTCSPQSGWVSDCTDCDDGSGSIHPDAEEVCNGVDDNCDGATDPDDATGAVAWYPDDDGDGYGDEADATVACDPPLGTVTDASDCDDRDADTHPGAAEICNDGRDNDCDGTLNGCGWEGERTLDTGFATYIAGPDANSEWMGFALNTGDVSGDGVADLIFSGAGGMFGDPTAGDVHLWYGAPTGARSVYEADGHLYGVPDAFAGVAEWGAPARPIDLGEDGTVDLVVAGGGWSDEYGHEGVLFAVSTPVYGAVQLAPDDIWARGASPYEGFGAGFVLTESMVEGASGIVIAAPEQSDRAEYGGALYVAAVDHPDAVDAVARVFGGEGDRVGLDVSGDGDVTGDGVDDLVIATHKHTPPSVLVFRGPLRGDYDEATADAVLADSDFGAEGVFAIPDLDGDGEADLAIQSFETLNLVPGLVTGEVAVESARIAHLESERDAQTSIGIAVAGADVGLDGEADLVVGLPEVNTTSKSGGVNAGGVVVVIPYSSIEAGANDARAVARATFYGNSLRGYFGGRLTLGDVNADGHLDLLAAATEADERGFQNNGAVWLLLGGGI